VTTTATMQAAVIRRHGGPEVTEVEELERPAAGPGEAVVRVAACGLNHLDIFVRRGMPGLPIPLPHVSGGDIAGWVDEVGEGASPDLLGTTVLVDPAVGDGALGETVPGGLAEYVVVPVENLIPLEDPDGLIAFAALPIAYGTAYRMIVTRARLAAGETIVILGASGGVGVACVQFAKRIGARVLACTSSAEKARRLRDLGADEAIDVLEEDFSAAVWKLTDKKGADVVVDYSGKETWPGSIRCTTHGGRIVTCGATTGFDATTDLRYVWRRELNILGSDGWTRSELLDVVGLVARGELDPVVHGVYPLSHVSEAIAQLEERRAFGKVVVVPDAVYGQVTQKEGQHE
jgi:alcohol dehydrogenase